MANISLSYKVCKALKENERGKSQVNAFNVQHSGAIWDELKQTLELSLRLPAQTINHAAFVI